MDRETEQYFDKKADDELKRRPPPPSPPEVLAAAREKFYQHAAAGIAEAMDRFNPDKVVAQIIKDLDKSRSDVTKALIGIDTSWGRIQIDHCNGRITALNNQIQDQFGDRIKAMVMEIMADEFEKPAFQAIVKKAIREQIRSALSGRDYQFREMCSGAANDMLRQLVAEVKAEFTPKVEGGG